MKRIIFMKLLGRKVPKKDEQKAKTLVFLVRLLVLAIPLYLVIVFGISLYPLQTAAGAQSQAILEGMGFSVERFGPYITTQRFGPEPFEFLVSEDSTAWKSLLFFAALVIAIPGVTWRKRLLGIIPGLIVIWVVNLGRIVGIVLAEEAFGKATALFVHDWGWRIGLVVLVLILWLIWLWFVKLRKRKKKRWWKR